MKLIMMKNKNSGCFIAIDKNSGYPYDADNIMRANIFSSVQEATSYKKHFQNLSVVEVTINHTEQVLVK